MIVVYVYMMIYQVIIYLEWYGVHGVYASSYYAMSSWVAIKDQNTTTDFALSAQYSNYK